MEYRIHSMGFLFSFHITCLYCWKGKLSCQTVTPNIRLRCVAAWHLIKRITQCIQRCILEKWNLIKVSILPTYYSLPNILKLIHFLWKPTQANTCTLHSHFCIQTTNQPQRIPNKNNSQNTYSTSIGEMITGIIISRSTESSHGNKQHDHHHKAFNNNNNKCLPK